VSGKEGTVEKERRVVWLGNNEAESRALQNLLSKHVTVTCAQNIPELLSILKSSGYDALFCAWSFNKSSWREALKEVNRRHPEVPMIVVHHSADEQEWVDVLDAGAVDLLGPPYMSVCFWNFWSMSLRREKRCM